MYGPPELHRSGWKTNKHCALDTGGHLGRPYKGH